MTPVLLVKEPGFSSNLHDLGRLHAIAAGVPPGGSMDRFAHAAANLLVGNDAAVATLECTLTGPHLVAYRACLVAITGADLDPRVNGKPAPSWTSMFLAEGDQVTFGGRRAGARAYIAIAGGFGADRWLGSLSTNTMAARGGMRGRSLKTGDLLATAAEPRKPAVSGRRMAEHLRPDYTTRTLSAIPGPHFKRLDPEGRSLLFTAPFKVSRDADRMGYRLEGPTLHTTHDELLSFGLTAGAVQVPRGGQPILLMADHQTAGGYPVVATVISASLPIAAQLLPGDQMHFTETTQERARWMRMALVAALDSVKNG